MNPVKKVESLLNGLTEPLCKDGPFSTGGRKTVFDSTFKDFQSLSYQGFVNRVLTFRPENWASNPNAAVYLAKHGYITVSGCKVRCCTCQHELDFKSYLQKDVLQTLAVKTHKISCRWFRVSTPEIYFEIPNTPLKALYDLKTTFTELMSLESSLPLIPKDLRNVMGIPEEFIEGILSNFQCPWDEIAASSVVLGLCGWVKRSDISLQCNFCQRSVGVWNFFSKSNGDSKPPTPSKNNVVSLLYSEIRRNMMSFQKTDGRIENEEKTSSPLSDSESEESPPTLECVSERDELDKLTDTDSSYSEYQRGFSFVNSLDIKRKALRCLWMRARKEKSCVRKMLESRRNEIELYFKRINQENTVFSSSESEQKSDGNLQLLHNHNSEILGSNCVDDSNENHQPKVVEIIECDASSDKNVISDAKCNNLEEGTPQSEKLLLTSGSGMVDNGNDDCESKSGLKQFSNDSKGPSATVTNNESTGIQDMTYRSGESNQCMTSSGHDTEKNNAQMNSGSVSELSEIKINQHTENLSLMVQLSESDKPHSNSEFRQEELVEVRGEKRPVPECEQNGTPHETGVISHKSELQHPRVIKKMRKNSDIGISNHTASLPTNGIEIIDVKTITSKEMLVNASENATLSAESTICNEVTENRMEMENSEKNTICNEVTENRMEMENKEKNTICNEVTENRMEMENGEKNTICNEVRENRMEMENSEKNTTKSISCKTSKDSIPVAFSVAENADIPIDSSEKKICSTLNTRNSELPSGGLNGSSSVGGENPMQDTVQEEVDSHVENSDKAKGNERMNCEQVVAIEENIVKISQENAGEENCCDSPEVNVSICEVKRKRNDSEEESDCDLKKKKLEDFQFDFPLSNFHPELEHRYWCIWRFKFADNICVLSEKKGWEHFSEVIKKALELHNADKVSVFERRRVPGWHSGVTTRI